MGATDRARGPSFDRLLEGYSPLSGVPDEVVDSDGKIRPHWRRFLEMLGGLGRDEVARRFAGADRYLRETGVFYRVYNESGGSERPWPLAHVPLLISSQDWATLSAGLIERAELLEAVLRDTYCAQQLVRDGLLPAAVVAGNPEFLRAMVDPENPGQHLWLYAADLGRGPDGRWWVLDDRTQAPSGAGFALENRVAMARALPNIFRRMNVHRLAGFFDEFRTSLAGLSSSESARVGLLSPGILNETYYEHAYLARYLGLLLLEGGDLTVRDRVAYVRTVNGLKRIDVLWRRLDASSVDPLALDSGSRLGVPGLVSAIRAGNLHVANSVGAGFAESNALLAFMPAIARHLIGQDAKLPNIATWWCGQANERSTVLAGIDRLIIAPANRNRTLATLPDGPVDASAIGATERAALLAAIERRGIDFVGQEMVHLSTMPVWDGERLRPHPFQMRVYVARTADGWKVMPGAFCRVSPGDDSRAFSMQAGAHSADVWVISDEPVQTMSLLTGEKDADVRRRMGTLPARAGDNFFWLGRYVERVDILLRLMRAFIVRAADDTDQTSPVQRGLIDALIELDAIDAEQAEFGALAIGKSAFGCLPQAVAAALNAAARVRDRLSPDGWRALRDLSAMVSEPFQAASTESDVGDRIGQALRLVAAFSGLAQENMSRLTGWRFLEIGRRIERAAQVAPLVDRFTRAALAPVGLDVLLELIDSSITYRQRYSITASRVTVVDLAVLDPNNPRSIAFQVARIAEHVGAITGADLADMPGELRLAVRRLQADLDTTRASQVDSEFLRSTEDALYRISDLVGTSYFSDNARSEPGELFQ